VERTASFTLIGACNTAPGSIFNDDATKGSGNSSKKRKERKGKGRELSWREEGEEFSGEEDERSIEGYPSR